MVKAVYFISDAHLMPRGDNSATEDRLLAVFERAKAEASHLYIVGDLFDFWFEYRYAIPAAYLKVLAALLDLTRSGVKVFYIPGNHDFWMKDYIQREAGVILTGDFHKVGHFGRKILITHGDGLRRDDTGYRFLKKLFRNRACIWLYSQLPVNVAYRLAMRSSKASRNYTTGRKRIDPSDYVAFARGKVAQGYDAVVMGHVHLPQIEDLGDGQYVNCGEFFANYNYVVLDEGGFRMCRIE